MPCTCTRIIICTFYYCASPHATPLGIPSGRSTDDISQQHNTQMYCGYCNILCKTPPALVTHCKQKSHKHRVFADSGRDVFWQYEPPPSELKKDEISEAHHG